MATEALASGDNGVSLSQSQLNRMNFDEVWKLPFRYRRVFGFTWELQR